MAHNHNFDRQTYRVNGELYQICLHCNTIEKLEDNRLPTIGFHTIGSAVWKPLANPSHELVRVLKQAQTRLNLTQQSKKEN